MPVRLLLPLVLPILLAAVAVPDSPALASGTARRPNVLVIVADDLGYADPGFQGGRDVPTPRLDALAASGVRCTAGYVSGPYCSPTRAGLLTGRYQQRFGHEFNPGPPAAANIEIGLPLSERTLPELLRAEGYRTGLVGKWHLGHDEAFLPQRRGFEEYFGFLGGAHPYLPEGDVDEGFNTIRRGHDPVDEPEYLTRAFAREAISFIDRHRDEPFFLLLAFNAVHGPLQAPLDSADRFPGIADPRRKAYAEMLAELDVAVGRVLDRLDETKLADDTLVVFISDNGGPPANASSNGALRGFKASTWEGGIRVPFVIRWPGRVPAGKTFDHPVIQLDILPTALAAAGVAAPDGLRLDGVDLVPHLAGQVKTPPHERLYWRFGEQTAIRSGNWKLVRANGVSDAILVNLVDDAAETTDQSAANPGKRQELESAWRAWNGQLTAPLWKKQARPGQGRQRQRRAGSAAS